MQLDENKAGQEPDVAAGIREGKNKRTTAKRKGYVPERYVWEDKNAKLL